MKILVLSHEYPPVGGGGANACINLTRELALAGHEVYVVTVKYKDTPENEEIVFTPGNNIEGKKVRIIRVPSKRTYVDHCSFTEMLDYLVKAMPQIVKLQKSEKFDVCQVFFGIPSGPLGLLLKLKYGVPYVIRFGGGDIPGAQKRFAMLYKVLTPIIKVVWKNALALVANSNGLKSRAEGFYSEREIYVIPNGVNKFDTEDHSIEKVDNEVALLFVSRLIEGKGLQDIFPYIKKLANACQMLNKKLVFRIVGDGPYRQQLEEFVDYYDIRENVIFCGYKSKDQLADYYIGADIFVFPSRSEGMPNAVLEAMVYGLPIIMTPCEGSDELIDGNGFVAKPEEFTDRILDLIREETLRVKMGEKSTYLANSRFVWKKTAEKYLEIYSQCTTS